MVFDLGFAELDHFLRRVGDFKQCPCGFIDPCISGLGRQHDGYQQCVGIDIIELALRFRVGVSKFGVERINNVFFHRELCYRRMRMTYQI